MELARSSLNTVPDGSSSWRGALGADHRVYAEFQGAEGVLHVGALGEAGSEESRVQAEQDPRAALEEHGRKKDADPEEDLEARDDGHGGVVVGLDEGADSFRERVWLRLGARRGGLWWLDGGDDVAAKVGRHVKDGVDSVGQQRKGILRR